MMEKDNSSSEQEFIYGIHPVLEYIKSGKAVERLFIQDGLNSPAAKELKVVLKQFDIGYQQVPGAKLNRITRKNHQGVICYLSLIEYQDLQQVISESFSKSVDPIIVILDRITDVRNFGSICRTAECMGASAVLIPERGGALLNAEAMKASAGALSRLPVCREFNLKNAIRFLKESGLVIISCSEKGTQNIYDHKLNGPVAVIMGSEGEGVSSEYMKLSDHTLKIPMTGTISSLNVSVATGMILYELTRQRNQH